ncbi:MAG: NADH-quinone oxidoreductase subunit L [Candidatus Riflebacteria bacterium]|nr:NADH-quinone oxidoreductase subunit L [Candidatus Riflebacteria bacterium]
MNVFVSNDLWLIPLIPFVVGFAIGLFGRYVQQFWSGFAACLAMLASLVYSIKAVFLLASTPADVVHVKQHVWTWMTSGGLTIDFSLVVDQLTAVMILIVTGVGFLIHYYSLGYMEHDHDSPRFFCQLNLFAGFMLLLVMASNLLVMFVGWEGVGACSYLLIGFYFKESEKAAAGQKAFLVNRIGDVFFVLGVLLLLYGLAQAGLAPTLEFAQIKAGAGALEDQRLALSWGTAAGAGSPLVEPTSVGLVTMVCLLLFVGATGKSAQIPLFVWLPDAMAGPTPVSALIHAATMVTAGVYMVCRLHFLFVMSPTAMAVIAWVGALTALMAGVIGLAQRDIKRVLAYSTISQLGYMFLAAGVGAFAAAIFHLLTHAFFKALLFLGAGSVIHGLKGEQDIFKMGGLRTKLPVTHLTFVVGALAIAGVPPLAGFFSKDLILYHAYSSRLGSPGLYLIALITAVLTAFYMFRMVTLVFWGESRVDRAVKKHIHESPPSMTITLMFLAVLSAMAGFLNLPKILKGSEWFDTVLHPVFARVHVLGAPDHRLEGVLMLVSILVAVIGVTMTTLFYLSPRKDEALEELEVTWVYRAIYRKFAIDELYALIVVCPLSAFSRFLKDAFDGALIDRTLVNGPPRLLKIAGRFLSEFQSGDVQRYLLLLTLGMAAIVVYLIKTL